MKETILTTYLNSWEQVGQHWNSFRDVMQGVAEGLPIRIVWHVELLFNLKE